MAPTKYLLTVLDEQLPPRSIRLVLRLDSKKPPLHSGWRGVQAYKFSDEVGNKMRGVLFASNVDFLDRILQTGRYYDIQNILVKPVDERFTFYPGKLQLNLTSHTQVHEIEPTALEVPFTKTFTPLWQLSSKLNKGHFDIAVIIVSIDKTRDVILPHNSKAAKVTDLYATDDTTDYLTRISAWRELGNIVRDLQGDTNPYTVAVFKSIKANTYAGDYPISTTSKTVIQLADNEVTRRLTEWVGTNLETLASRLLAHNLKRPIKKEPVETTLAEALNFEGDLLKFDAFMTSIDNNSPRTIFTCNRCNCPGTKPTEGPSICTFCKGDNICTGKMFVDFTVSDDDVSYSFRAQTKQSQKLLGLDATDYHFMTDEEKSSILMAITQTFSQNQINLVVEPNAARLHHGELLWELKYLD